MDSYERIEAGAIVPGDRVARARTHEFVYVERVELHPTSVSLYAVPPRSTTGRITRWARPRKTARWWVLREQTQLEVR